MMMRRRGMHRLPIADGEKPLKMKPPSFDAVWIILKQLRACNYHRYYYDKLGFRGVEEAPAGEPPSELVALCREYLRGLNWCAKRPYLLLLILHCW